MRPWHGYKSARTRAAPRSLCASVSAHGKARSRLKMRPAEKFRALVNTVGPKRALEVSGIGGTVTGDGWGVPGRSHRQLDRRRTQVSRGIQALADGDPDLRRCDSAIPFLHGRGDGLGLGVGTVVSIQCRRLPVHVGIAAGDGVQPAFHVVHRFTAQQAQAPAEDLGGGAVVDVQPRGPAGDVDPDLAQADPVFVDALVGVAGDEDVVGSFAPPDWSVQLDDEFVAQGPRHA